MKQIIILLMLVSSAYAQSFYMSDCILKSRRAVELIIKPREVVPLSLNEQYDMYRYDDSIMVTFENDVCTYIDVTSDIKFAAAQIKHTLDKFVASKTMIFNKVFIYDREENQYLMDIFNDGDTDRYSIYIQLLSTAPIKRK